MASSFFVSGVREGYTVSCRSFSPEKRQSALARDGAQRNPVALDCFAAPRNDRDSYVPGRDTSVSFEVMNSSSTGTPSLVLAMPRWIAGTMSSGLVTRSP